MASSLPSAPEFGAACPITASDETLALLARRRSSSAALLRGSAPSADQLQDLIRIATRVPDHGKLAPWRFVVMRGEAKAALVERLRALAPGQPNPDKASATLAKLTAPPVTVMVVSSPKDASAIPLWEQQLSAAAVCTLFLVAAGAMGFGANWITDWYAYEPQARGILGLAEGEAVAGFIHLGTPAEPPQERDRPDVQSLISYL